MTQVQKLENISINDFLKMEEKGETRHEYVNGRIFAMVGGTARHNIITTTIASTFRDFLSGSGCTVFMSDMKLRIQDVFYYPDVMVVCEKIELDSLFQSSPALIVEVLSNSTEAKDRLEKLVAYQSIPSVQEYVLVAQDKVSIDIYRRDGNDWELASLGYGDTVTLSSINYDAPCESFYADVIGSLSQ